MEDINQADHLNPEPFKCPLNNCNKQFFVMAELKNHVLDHYLIYRRKFEWFQRVKVVDDTEIYVIIYVDRATDTFLVRCDESVGRHNNQYIPSERLLPVIVPKINDIIGIDRENVLPTQRNYINSLELAIITEERTYDDGHSSWVVHSIKNKKWEIHDERILVATNLKKDDVDDFKQIDDDDDDNDDDKQTDEDDDD